MKNNHNKWRLNRIAGALAVALLLLCEDVLAREVFNPALLEMDGPHTGVRDLSVSAFLLNRSSDLLSSGNNGITALPDGRRFGRMGRARLPISRAGPQIARLRGYQRDTAGKI